MLSRRARELSRLGFILSREEQAEGVFPPGVQGALCVREAMEASAPRCGSRGTARPVMVHKYGE